MERAEHTLHGQQAIEVGLQGGFHPSGIDFGVVDGCPHGFLAQRGVHDPVDHVRAMMIIHGERTADALPLIFDATLYSRHFLRFEILVGLVAVFGIIQFGERRHTQRHVIRGKHFPTAVDAITGIHTGIKFERHLVPCVLHGSETGRQGKVVEQHVVFKTETQVAAVEPQRVVAVGAMNVYRLVERFAKIAAHQIFVAHISTESGAAQ